MKLGIDSIQLGQGYYLELSESEMIDSIKYAVWEHLITGHISDSRHGLPDSAKSRSILSVIAKLHNVELSFLHDEPMNNLKKKQARKRKAECN